MPNITYRLPVDNGKYIFLMYSGDWRIHVLRHEEPWLIIEKGYNAIFALLYECIEAKEELRKLKSKLETDDDDDYDTDMHPANPDY